VGLCEAAGVTCGVDLDWECGPLNFEFWELVATMTDAVGVFALIFSP
jgi:hypothetical protein